MYTRGRKKAETEPTPPARDPRDVEMIERLQQQIQELELRSRRRDDPIRIMGLKIEIPEFTGKVHPDDFIDWLSTDERVFDVRDSPNKLKVKLMAIKLRQHASLWWYHVTKRLRMKGKSKVETWEKMKKLMKAKFLPENHRQEAFLDYHYLSQWNMTVEEVINKFDKLHMRCDVVEEEEQVVARFLGVLKLEIADIAKSKGTTSRFTPPTRTTPSTTPKTTTPTTLAAGNTRECVNSALYCYKCSGIRHYARDCPNLKTLAFVPDDAGPIYDTDAEPELDEPSDELVYPDRGEALVIQRVLNVAVSKSVDDNLWLRRGSNLFMKQTDFEGLMKTSPYVFTLVVVEENEIISEALLQVQPLLREFVDVIPDDIPPGLPAMRDIQHCIDFIPGSVIPNRPAYRMNQKEFAELQRQVTELLEKGLIRESMSPCAVPALLVPKHGGTFWMCIDSRAMYKITIKYRFPIPRLDDLLDQLHGFTIFSKIDLRSGYHQIQMRPGDEWKTDFKTRDGLYEWMVMPFELSNAPSTFMRLMNQVFKPFIGHFVVIYFDDILIYSSSLEQHLSQKLYANGKKCHFLVTEVTFLWYIVTGSGIKIDPAKAKAIISWPTPSTIYDIRSFHGLASFYRLFIQNFSSIIAPLTECMKGGRFTWTIFQVECDAFGVGIGGVLSQNQRPIAFFSEKLNDARRKYSTYDKEFYAIIRSLDTWRHYLLSNKFVMFSDYEALKFINGQHKLKSRHAKLLERCRTCHIAKTQSSYAGLYTPLSVPVAPWEDVSLDFVLGLPRTQRAKDSVMLHGVPKTLTSDRDVKFVSHFWHTLWTRLGSKLQFSSSHHPQTDGQTEVVNRSLGNLLRNKSPFKVMYGRNPITPLDLVPVPKVGHFSEEGADQSEQIKELHRSINDNAYKIKLPGHYNVSATFNVADLLPYKGDSDDEPDSGSSLFQEGEDDAGAVNEQVNMTNTLDAYFAATNFCGGLG
ncbi:RNA-directed DNA polymerase [Tanacetum coccineum]